MLYDLSQLFTNEEKITYTDTKLHNPYADVNNYLALGAKYLET